MVYAQDGFEIPVMINELLIDNDIPKYTETSNPNTGNISVQTAEEPEEEPFYSDSNEVNLYLAYIPKDQKHPNAPELEIAIINDSNYYIYYSYSVATSSNNYKSINGKLGPNTKELISEIDKNKISENLNLNIQLIFFDKKEFNLRPVLDKHIKIKAVKIHQEKSYKDNDFFDEKVMIIPIIEENPMSEAVKSLTEKDMKKVYREKEIDNKKQNRPRLFKKQEKKTIKEVDLHLYELIDDETGLSNHDKLQIQTDKFKSEMESAIKEQYEKIVFIHGLGAGTLKMEIRKLLKTDFKKYEFQDASFKEYGYGATMVLLKR